MEEMQASMNGLPCHFAGYLKGDDLVQAYASSDAFVFPSVTDTFGNVVLEAQASGLPVIVTDQGGPCENMVHEETGMVVPGGSASALRSAMQYLTGDPARVARMGKAARQYVESRSFEAAFLKTWEMFCDDPVNIKDKQTTVMAV